MKRKVNGNPTIVVLEFYGIIGGGQAVIGKYTMNALRKFIERNIVQCVMVLYKRYRIASIGNYFIAPLIHEIGTFTV